MALVAAMFEGKWNFSL